MYNSTPTTTSGSLGNYASPQATEAVSPSRIRDGITHSEESLSAIHEAISSLEARLETVLQPQPPSTVANAGAKPVGPPASHVMGRVLILNEGFELAAARLRELARRVEV